MGSSNVHGSYFGRHDAIRLHHSYHDLPNAIARIDRGRRLVPRQDAFSGLPGSRWINDHTVRVCTADIDALRRIFFDKAGPVSIVPTRTQDDNYLDVERGSANNTADQGGGKHDIVP